MTPSAPAGPYRRTASASFKTVTDSIRSGSNRARACLALRSRRRPIGTPSMRRRYASRGDHAHGPSMRIAPGGTGFRSAQLIAGGSRCPHALNISSAGSNSLVNCTWSVVEAQAGQQSSLKRAGGTVGVPDNAAPSRPSGKFIQDLPSNDRGFGSAQRPRPQPRTRSKSRIASHPLQPVCRLLDADDRPI